MTLPEALAIELTYKSHGFRNKLQNAALSQARKMIQAEAAAALQTLSGVICTTCWGDGWHRPSPAHLQGACQVCGGSGRAAGHEGDGR